MYTYYVHVFDIVAGQLVMPPGQAGSLCIGADM